VGVRPRDDDRRDGLGGDGPRSSGHGADPCRDPAERSRAAEAIAEGMGRATPGEVPGRLCEVAVRLLPVTGASASLRSDGVPVQLCASGDLAAYLSDIQTTLGEGPCVEATETGRPVLARDLATGPDARRWPVYAQEATAVGVRAVYALPLGNDSVCVGTLDLYRDTPGTLTGPELHTARLIAAVMTVALMALPHGEEYDIQGGAPWLSGLAAEHDEVFQAVGMIMAQLGVGADEALARLRAHAFAHGRTAHDVARAVVTHRERFERDR
jgi:GAF domain-containing protein